MATTKSVKMEQQATVKPYDVPTCDFCFEQKADKQITYANEGGSDFTMDLCDRCFKILKNFFKGLK